MGMNNVEIVCCFYRVRWYNFYIPTANMRNYFCAFLLWYDRNL